jgi:hypothetical protein
VPSVPVGIVVGGLAAGRAGARGTLSGEVAEGIEQQLVGIHARLHDVPLGEVHLRGPASTLDVAPDLFEHVRVGCGGVGHLLEYVVELLDLRGREPSASREWLRVGGIDLAWVVHLHESPTERPVAVVVGVRVGVRVGVGGVVSGDDADGGPRFLALETLRDGARIGVV